MPDIPLIGEKNNNKSNPVSARYRDKHRSRSHILEIDDTLTLPQVASAILLCDLPADDLSLGLLSTWMDASGNGRDFTATGSARPDVQAIGDYKAVVFDGVDNVMTGDNFADNLASLALVVVCSTPNGGTHLVLSKEDSGFASGYELYTNQLLVYGSATNNVSGGSFAEDTKILTLAELINRTNSDLYLNGDNSETNPGDTEVADYLTSGTVKLAAYGDGVADEITIYRLLIYQITDLVNWHADRDAINAWLVNRYGITS